MKGHLMRRPAGETASDDRYKWVALANTTAAMFMATLDGSIVIIALPAIFRGIHLDPLAPGNISYLLWMIMGYRLVQAVLVVTVGRLGDMFGRVKIYNAGFVVFTVASILLSFDPFEGGRGALWLIGWRVLQAVGGSMLMANSAAILTDAFPAEQRGFALGTNQIAGLAGMFVGLVAGGLLAAIDWRAVFWVNVPVGIYGRSGRTCGSVTTASGTGPASTGGATSPSETFTDARVERYWQLLAIINGQPVPPSLVPGFEWLIAALRADLGS